MSLEDFTRESIQIERDKLATLSRKQELERKVKVAKLERNNTKELKALQWKSKERELAIDGINKGKGAKFKDNRKSKIRI